MNEKPEVTAMVERRRCLRWSPEEQKEWVSRFEESGLSAREFSAQHGMHWATLYRWLSAKRTREAVASLTPDLIEVPLPPRALERVMPNWSAELVLGNGKVLRLQGEIPAATLQQLLAVC
jgi:transposase-like protein